jgi:hypothetical protein
MGTEAARLPAPWGASMIAEPVTERVFRIHLWAVNAFLIVLPEGPTLVEAAP